MDLFVVCLSKSWGGMEMVAVETAIEMSSRGGKVGVACPAGSHAEEVLRSRNIPCYPVSTEGSWVSKILVIRKYLKDLGPKAVMIHQLRDLKVITPALVALPKCELIGVSHFFLTYKKTDLLHRWFYSRLDKLVVLTDLQKQNHLNMLPLAPDRIFVIPDWISPKIHESKDTSDLKALFPENLRHLPIGIIASRLDPQKGQELALRAQLRAQELGRPFLLVFLGENTFGERDVLTDLKTMALKNGLSRHVRFLGYQDDAFKFLRGADFVLVPSKAETFGRVIIESFALGLPVIASNRGGVPAIVQDQKNGILFESEDAESLEQKITLLMTQPGLRERVRRGAFESSAGYDKDVIFKRLEPLFLPKYG